MLIVQRRRKSKQNWSKPKADSALVLTHTKVESALPADYVPIFFLFIFPIEPLWTLYFNTSCPTTFFFASKKEIY